MRTHVGALSALIDDLFELSRLEAGEIAWSMQQVRLDELVRRDGRGDAPRRPSAGDVGVRAALDGALARRARATPSRSSACCST